MRILAVSDIESPRYYEYYKAGSLDEFDLIIACGDLKREYLEFLVTLAPCPLLYVHGNHDEYERAPEGCICIDGRLYEYGGLRIMGLGGSYRYRDGKYMYTEKEMKRRIRRLFFPLRRSRGVDILVTHAPARHLNDMEGLSHRGFECFNTVLKKYEPKLFLHGHVHRGYEWNIPQKAKHGNTTVINAFDYCIVNISDDGVVE